MPPNEVERDRGVLSRRVACSDRLLDDDAEVFAGAEGGDYQYLVTANSEVRYQSFEKKYSQIPQGLPIRRARPMREQQRSIDAAVVYNPQRLQVVLERMPNEDGVGVHEGVQPLANSSEIVRGALEVLGPDAGEPGVVIAGERWSQGIGYEDLMQRQLTAPSPPRPS